MGLKTFRIVWIAVLVCGLFWLLQRALVPSGQISYTSDFSKETYFMDPLLPAERVQNQREIIDEPVYFSVFTTRDFSRATVTVTFAKPSPALQIGAEHDKAKWIYDFKPVSAGTRKAELHFDLENIKRKKGKYTFMISDPNLGDHKPISIDTITVQFNGRSLKDIWQKK